MTAHRLHINWLTISLHVLLWASLVFSCYLYVRKVAGDAFVIDGNFIVFFGYNIFLFYLTAWVVIPRALRKKVKWYYSVPLYILLEVIVLLTIMLLLSLAAGGLEISFDTNQPYLVNIANFFHLLLLCFGGLLLSIGYYFLRWAMVERRKNRELKQAIDNLLNETELLRQDWLKAQLSPHLIFNILPALRFTTINKPQVAVKITLILSAMMCYYINESPQGLIPLEDEIAQTKNLIKLNEIRWDAKSQIKWRIDEHLQGLRTLPMLLLLLVENMFKYGIVFNEKYPAEIKIMLVGARLFISTKNDINPSSEVEETGTGLQNLRERLEYFYSDKHTFDYGRTGELFQVEIGIDPTLNTLSHYSVS